LTGVEYEQPIHQLVSSLSIQDVLRNESELNPNPAFQLLKMYQKQTKLMEKSKRRINGHYWKRGQRIWKRSPNKEEQNRFLEDWYKQPWGGARLEIEIVFIPGTQILFEMENVDIEKFLQYYLDQLSFLAIVEPANYEVELAMQCFMTSRFYTN
jgi:hypothetical protein